MSKKGGDGGGGQQIDPYAEELANISRTIFGETTPLRQDLTDAYTQMGSDGDFFAPVTDQSLTQNPLYDVLKLTNERQFDSARDRVLENTPNGGVLFDALGNVEVGRATNMTNQLGALAENEQNQRNQFRGEALQLASGGTAGALSGLSGAGSLNAQAAQTQAAIYNADANRDAGKAQGAGELVGTLGSAAIKKCWVAREIYGANNPEWLLFFDWKENRSPLLFKWAYNTFGEYFALFIKDKKRVKSFIKTWMDSKIGGES